MKVIAPVLIPAVLAGAMLLAAWGPWSRTAPERRAWGGVLALLLAFASGYVVLVGAPEIPPIGARDTLFWAVTFTALLASGEWLWGASAVVALPIRFLASGLTAWFVLASLRQNSWSTGEAALWIAGIAAVTALVSGVVERTAQPEPGPWLPLTLWLISSTAAAAMVLVSTALMGQLSGSLAAGLGAPVVLAAWNRELTLARGAITVFITAHSGLLWQAYFYAELPLTSALLLYLAPATVGVVLLPNINRLAPWKREAVQLAVAAVPLAIAILIAYGVYRQNQSLDANAY